MDIFTGKKSAGIGYSLFFCLFVLISFIGQTVLQLVCETESFAYKFIYSFFSCITMLLIIVLFSVKRKEKLVETVNLKKFNPTFLIFSFLIFASMYFGMGLVNDYISTFFKNIGLNIVDTSIKMNNVKEYLGFIFSLAILPAVFEEMFFRGFLLTSLKNVSPIKSIIFVSLCFSLYHGNVSQLIYQFVYGFFLGALAYSSKSIIPSIIAHFLNNFIILTILFFEWDVAYLNYNVALVVIGLVVLALMLTWFIIRTVKKTKNENFENVLGAYTYAVIGFILTILMIVLNLVAL